ncbi:MAG: (d)CMP kinase [Rubrobacteraceae bacterium]|uniref:(d)CMP kinase n=1 Tax=Rubrobacter naiadicus TaxID=1392641 RepID=UPI0023630BDD|nr:(d)CMP kinase [Rubrobacter naiadicus]MCL6438145.1 (d)CMP kinase [Rubrobacteraceae bacterium]
MGGFLVAIDGPAGSGKSSVAREVARRLGVTDISTGAVYRAVALVAIEDGVDPADEEGLVRIARRLELGPGGVRYDGRWISGEELHAPEVSGVASKVSAHPRVREVLLPVQRRAAEEARRAGGAVVEGRDIGTVVLPEADLKIFLSASTEERARRRALQSGREADLDEVREAIMLRDRQDTERESAPLRPAPDAVIVDTTGMGFEEVVEKVMGLARRLCGPSGG